ncbi:DUF4424 family protein [Methylocella tundrae]
MAVGGVTFTQSPDVSMEEEVLTITPDTVTVLYRFLNPGNASGDLDRRLSAARHRPRRSGCALRHPRQRSRQFR